MATTAAIADQDKGTVTASTQSFSLKSGVDNKGQHRDYIEGFLATTHLDKGNDRFTPEALKMMAEDINDQSVDAVFRDVDQDELREAQTGNIDHDTNPASPFGDTRTVPAFKTVKAEVRETEDGEQGLWIKSMLNSDGMPSDTVSAIKNSIRDNFLNAFSIEFVPEKVRQVTEGSKVVRIIEKAAAKGAALTGRPMNPEAQMTGADLKSMASEYKVEYAYSIGDEVSWNETSGTVRDRTKDSCFNEKIDGDFEVCGTKEEPAYLIEVDNEEGTMVGHKQGTLSAKSLDVKAELTEEQRTPPQAAQDNAQMYLDAKDEGEVGSDCGTGTGTRRAKQIAEGSPLSRDVIEDIAGFARHEGNKEADVDEDESKWQDCGYAMWKAWGGDEGVNWAQDKNDMMDDKNDITMSEDEDIPEEEVEEEDVKSESEAESEGVEEESGDGESEEKSFSEDISEIKETVSEVKSVNDELREENEELKSELEDLRQLQEIKSEVDDVKSMLEDVNLEDGPRVQNEQKRFEDEESKAEWKQAADRLGEDYLKMKGKTSSNIEAFAENHGIELEEVKNYVNSN